MEKNSLGFLGEKIAEVFLKKKGYEILDKNYGFRPEKSPQKGEIDLIVKKDNIIIFVEVKTSFFIQKSKISEKNLIFSPESRVNYQKQKKIIKSAQSWLLKNNIPLDIPWKIDVIALEIDKGLKKTRIRHFKNIGFSSY